MRTYASRPNPTDAELLAWALPLWPDAYRHFGYDFAPRLFAGERAYYLQMYERELHSTCQRKAA